MWSLYIVYHFWILFLFVCLLEKSRRNFNFTKHTLNARFAARTRTHTHRERENKRERTRENERERERERERKRESTSSSSSLHPNSKSNSQKATPAQTVRRQIIKSKTNHYRIFSGLVPVCAATNFFKSPIVSSSLHFTRIFFPKRSFKITSIICIIILSSSSSSI